MLKVGCLFKDVIFSMFGKVFIVLVVYLMVYNFNLNSCCTHCIYISNMCNLTFLFESVHIRKLKCNTAYSLLFTNIINQRAGKARVNA